MALFLVILFLVFFGWVLFFRYVIRCIGRPWNPAEEWRAWIHSVPFALLVMGALLLVGSEPSTIVGAFLSHLLGFAVLCAYLPALVAASAWLVRFLSSRLREGHGRTRDVAKPKECRTLFLVLSGLAFLALVDLARIPFVGAGRYIHGSVYTRRIETEARNSMRLIFNAVMIYGTSPGVWPADLHVLVEEGYIDEEVLRNPKAPTEEVGFVYVRPSALAPGETLPRSAVLLYEAYDKWPRGGVLVCFRNRYITTITSEEQLLQAIARTGLR